MNNTFFKYQHFIETLSSVTKSERTYIEETNDKVFYRPIGVKPNKFKTQQIIDTATNSLNLIENDQPGISLELRVKLIGDLNQALDAYANRISKKVENRWWYFIMRIFNCPKCPATLTALQQKTQSTLLLLTQKKEAKEQERKRGIQRKDIQQLNTIRTDNQKKRCESAAKACKKWKSFIQTKHKNEERKRGIQRKVIQQLNTIRTVNQKKRSESVKKWKSFIQTKHKNEERKRGIQRKVIQQLNTIRTDNQKKRCESAAKACKKWKSFIQTKRDRPHILSPEEARQGELNDLRKRCEQQLQNIQKTQKVYYPDLTYPLKPSRNHWDKSAKQVKFIALGLLSYADLVSMKTVSKMTSNLVQAFIELNKMLLTEEEIDLWSDNSRREEYYYFCAQELEEIHPYFKWLTKESELRRMGFTEHDIETAKMNIGGLRKLFKEAKEAERCLKFCRYLPKGKEILRKIGQKYVPDTGKESNFELLISDFNLTEVQLTREELDEQSEASFLELEELPKHKPRLGGQDLLAAADEVRNFMRSEEGQKIKNLTIVWLSPKEWKNRTATQLDTLPLAINLLKGLEKLILIDHNETFRCCKKLPPLNLPNLKKLIIQATDIQKLPVMNVPNLEMCEFSDNLMTDMPSFRGNFDQLHILKFHTKSQNTERKLRSWSETAKLPPHLIILKISSSLRELPNSIGKLYLLNVLDIYQSAGKIPKRESYEESIFKDIWSKEAFEEYETRRLDSYRHDITSIPPGIMFLKNLRVLKLKKCELRESTPGLEWIALLQNLRKLDLRYNRFPSTPKVFQLLPKDSSVLI